MKRAVRATVAFVVLAAFTIGMPAFLVKAVGNPWPGRLAFQIRNDHALIVAGLAVVCWLAWARLIVAVVTETVRALRWYRSQPHPEHLTNPTAPTVPLPAGGGAVGPLVFRLVVAILVVLPTVSRATPARATVTSADPVMRPPAVTRTVTSSERSSPDTTPAAATAPFAGEVAVVGERPLVTVAVGDTLRGLARDHLGDPDRWRELFDLNRHRPQPDGQQLTSPSMIRPGWTLQLPTPPTPAGATPAGAPTATVQPGDTLWNLIAEAVHDTPTAADVVAVAAVNDGVVSDDGVHVFHRSDPDLINPGQHLDLTAALDDHSPTVAAAAAEPVAPSLSSDPPIVDPPPSVPPPPAALVTVPAASNPPVPVDPAAARPAPATTASAHAFPPPIPHDPTDPSSVGAHVDESPVSLTEIVGWTGSAAAAVGLLAAARRLRRRRGTTHPRPSSNARDIDLVLRATDNLTASQWAAVTLRTLAATIATRTASAHNIACVTIGDDGLDVLWDDPDPDVVTDWCTVDGGWTWHRPRAATVSTVRAPIPPCPTLVTVGRLNDSDVMINLETAGTVHLLGDATATADLARSFVVELASSPFTDAATVLLCAFDVAGCEHLDWVRPVSVQDAIGWLTSTASSASDHADGQPLLTRRARTGDSYTPTIVLVDAAIIEHDEVDRLVAAAGLTAIVVTINHPVGYDTGWTITCSPDSVRLDRYRFTVLRSTGVSEPAADHVAAYLAEAAGETVTDHDLVALLDPADPTCDPCPVSVDPSSLRSSAYGVHPDDLTTSDEPVDVVDTVAVAVEGIGADREDRDEDPLNVSGPFAYLLRTLGSIDCNPAAGLSTRELEFAVYLAVHRDGASSDTIKTMLWPGGVSPSGWANVTSGTRIKLGNNTSGNPRIPARPKRWTIDESVITDWDLFVGYARAASEASTTGALDYYRHALSLIRGRPFADVDMGYSWAYSDGTVYSEMLPTIVSVTHTAAQLALDSGDTRTALWCLARGHRALDARIDAQQLTLLEMQAHALAGQTGQAIAAYQALCRDLDEIDPGLEPTGEILRLYQQLTSSARSA